MKNSPFLGATKQFYTTVFRALTDLRFFREARRRSVSEVIGYLSVLLILTWLIPFAVSFFTGIRATNDALISGIRQHVPADTHFVMKDAVFTTNLEEPIVLENNGLTFIVNSASSSLALEEEDIGIVINRDAMVQREGTDRVRVMGYSDFPDFDLDRAGVDKKIATFGPWIIFFVSTAVILAFTLMTVVGFGVFILLHAFIFRFVMRLLKEPLPFARAFVVAAYAATIPILLKAAADWSGTNLGSAPTFLYWILLGFVIYDFKKMGRDDTEPRKVAKNDKQEKVTEKTDRPA